MSTGHSHVPLTTSLGARRRTSVLLLNGSSFHYGDGRTNHTFEAQAESRSASQDSTGMPLCAGIPHLSN